MIEVECKSIGPDYHAAFNSIRPEIPPPRPRKYRHLSIEEFRRFVKQEQIIKQPAFLASLYFVCFASSIALAEIPSEVAKQLEKQNITWNSPSADATGSMPIGNGNLGANVWVEPNGDLCFFISKTDSWDENQTLCKIGKVRVKFSPALVQEDQEFSQHLDLADGRILIESADAQVTFWIDANQPVIQIDATAKGGKQMAAKAQVELWRTEKRLVRHNELYRQGGYVYPDTVMPKRVNSVGWFHHNISSDMEANLKLQNISEVQEFFPDPIQGRTFGAIIRGKGWNSISDTSLETAEAATSHSLQIVVLTKMCDEPQQWIGAANALSEKVAGLDSSERLSRHTTWWHQFWNRSWIFATQAQSDEDAKSVKAEGDPVAWKVGSDQRNHSLFRGQLHEVRVVARDLSADEVKKIAAQAPAADLEQGDPDFKAEAFKDHATLMAWIKPVEGERGRILDQLYKGKGLMLDARPNDSLRLLDDRNTLYLPECLTPDVWQHVAITIDRKLGKAVFYIDGEQVHQDSIAVPEDLTAADLVTRGYTLQRFMTACAGRGAYPIKFNGSIFTVDNTSFGPDYRRWGGNYWIQNTRLIYWPMFMSGDHEMTMSYFDLYCGLSKVRRFACQKYFGHDGLYFPETMNIWGGYNSQNYGLNREGLPDGITDNAFIKYYWVNTLEILSQMLDYHAFTGDETFFKEKIEPYAEGAFLFFDKHWPRKDGKIHFNPAQSLETFMTDVTNPVAEIAALRHTLLRMIALTQNAEYKARWQRMLKAVPEIPTEKKGDLLCIAPAEKYGSKVTNFETPELYPVFPYRHFDLTSSEEDREMVRNTWDTRRARSRSSSGWAYNDINAALLGYTEEAALGLSQRAACTELDFRFPAMWRKNYDWMPDQDHGSNLLTATQIMLMQYKGDQIVLKGAWPKEWNAHFKLHAPKQTTVEAKIEDGKVTILEVTPKSRRQDIVIRQGDDLVPAR